MYEQFFGLTEKPFTLTPNPKYVFYSQKYREAEGQLLYGINSREGFMIVTGRPGTGKTTMCRDLLDKLDRSKTQSALLFNPFLNGVEMLAALLAEFGISAPPGGTQKDLLDRLNQFLLAQLVLGKHCVAIFDEAQHLSHEFLEQIRVLSNLETDQEKLIQIVLVGQPELLDKIRTPLMAQLDQRVSIRCTLADLGEQETERYIHHRLNMAGARGQVRISPAAMNEIYQASHGVPRLINLISDRALLAGFAAQTRDITPQHVRQGVMALRGEEKEVSLPSRPSVQSRRASASGGGAVVGGGGGGGGRKAWIAAASIVLVAAVTAAIAFLPGRLRAPDAETLYWRATTAAQPADAENDLKTLIEKFPQSPRANDALLQLAQLEMAQGDRQNALTNLGVLAQRTQPGPVHSRALLFSAKLQLEAGDTTAACREAAADSTATPPDAVLAGQRGEIDALCTSRAASASGAIGADSTTVGQAGRGSDTAATSQTRRDSTARGRTKRPLDAPRP